MVFDPFGIDASFLEERALIALSIHTKKDNGSKLPPCVVLDYAEQPSALIWRNEFPSVCARARAIASLSYFLDRKNYFMHFRKQLLINWNKTEELLGGEAQTRAGVSQPPSAASKAKTYKLTIL